MIIRASSVFRPLTFAVSIYLLGTLPTLGAFRDILDAVQASQFRFARAQSEVPFMPTAWIGDNFYPNSRFEPEQGMLPSFAVEENQLSLGGVIPVYVRTNDMIVLGGDLNLNSISIKSGPFRDQSVVRITPVAAWLRQVTENDLVSAFVAPMFSKETSRGGDWGTSGYAGIVAMHWRSDTLQWLYGGVYENSFGQDTFYPYLGLQWAPNPKVVVSLVFPWPTITYAPAKDWILQLGVSPGGSSWVQRSGSYEITESLASWNLQAGVGYQLIERFWLVGSAGVAGFRSWQLGEDDSGIRYEAKPSAVFSLALEFRP
jgi:hypothetical protein